VTKEGKEVVSSEHTRSKHEVSLELLLDSRCFDRSPYAS